MKDFTMNTISRIVVPSGRDYDRCLAAFEEESGLTTPRFTDRRLRLTAGGIDYTRVKGKDVPAYIAGGYADVGLTGTDVCQERAAQFFDDAALRYRAIGKPMCTFNILLPAEVAQTLSERLGDAEAKPVLVATSYPNFLNRCVEQARNVGTTLNIETSPFIPSGSVEVAPLLGMSEAVADLVESGDTAIANGLAIGLKLADVSPAIVWREIL